MCGNPQRRIFARRGILRSGPLIIISIISLFILKFKFWYIALIISSFNIFFYSLLISDDIKEFFYWHISYQLDSLWHKDKKRIDNINRIKVNNNEDRLKCIKKLDFYGLLTILSIVFLIILKFRFWYIALIISILTLCILTSLIHLTIKEFFKRGD